MSDNEKSTPAANERVHGYEIKRSIVFENDRGFALAENPNAPQSFVTWMFTVDLVLLWFHFLYPYPPRALVQTILNQPMGPMGKVKPNFSKK